jgi:integrase
MTKPKTVGPVRVRPQVTKGAQTGKWFVDVPASIAANGRRKRKLFDNRKKAMEAARRLAQLIDPVTGALFSQTGAGGLSLLEAIKGWAQSEELRVHSFKKRAKTLETDLYRLKAVSTSFGTRKISTITEEDLVEYQVMRLRLGRKPITVNGELKVLFLVLRWAKKRGHLDALPHCERIPERSEHTVIPSPSEVARVIHHLPEYLKPLIRFLAETGCRKGEAIHLTWDCVDLEGGFIEIRSREGWTPKTRPSERTIPIGQGLQVLLARMPRVGEFVFFANDPNQPIGEFRKTWQRAVSDADITRRGRKVYFPVKSLRKAYATWQAERGINESVLQRLLGHARGSKITRQFYVQVSDEAKRAAVIELPALD